MTYFDLAPRTRRRTQGVFYKNQEQLEEFLRAIPDKRTMKQGGVPFKVITTTRDLHLFPEKTRREKVQWRTFDEVVVLSGVELNPTLVAVDIFFRANITGGIVFGESEQVNIANIIQRALRDV